MKYTLSGEGAGTIFIIDQITGDIHALRSLDREEKSYYTLRAQAVDIDTNRPLEPESEFVIKVQDINDNEPKFLEGPYTASVPEMSSVGKKPIQMFRFFIHSFIYLGNNAIRLNSLTLVNESWTNNEQYFYSIYYSRIMLIYKQKYIYYNNNL